MCKTIYRIGCLLLLLLYVASLQSFAEMQPLDGSITRTGGTADCAWYYSSDAVTIGGKQFSGHGYVVDNHGDRAEGAITFDISGWERFTAVAGLKNEWHGQDGKLTIAVDGKQQFTRQLRAGEAGVAVDIALMGNKSLTISMVPSMLLAQTLFFKPAILNVNSTPAGASVLINGVNSWKTTPCTLTLPLGNETQKQVTLTLTSVGYDTIKQTLTVFSGTNPDCMMTLTRPPAILSVNSTPTGASVLIDGVDSRKTTPCTLTIPLGNDTQKHVVLTLTSVGYDTIKQTLTVRSGTNPYCVMTLTRLPAILLITTTPAGVTVMGNEIPFDQVTPCTLTFPMDKETKKQITLQLTLHEHETFTYTLTIHPADNLTLNYNMLKQVKVEKYNPNPIDGAALVWVPGSTLTMGSSDGVGQKDERPAHLVTMTGYWIYKYEVTVAQYRTFCAATHRKLPVFPTGYSWQGKRGWYDRALQQHPIVNVSWDDAQAYADWAEVALPTEAQWEYAARGPKGRNYPWGGTATANDPKNGWDETKCANGNNSYNVGKSTWPVGRFPAGASWCGAHDMAGNVWEWCADWLGDYPVTTAVTNPTGPATGKYRVVRGGSWGSGEFSLRSVGRIGDGPGGWGSGDIGFRCVSPSP